MSSRRPFQWPWSPVIPHDSPSVYSNHELTSSMLAEAVEYYAEYNPCPISRFFFTKTCIDSEFLHPRMPPFLLQPILPSIRSENSPPSKQSSFALTSIDRSLRTQIDLAKIHNRPSAKDDGKHLSPLSRAMNLCAISLIVLAVYMGVSSTDLLGKNAFCCGSTNSLRKNIVSGAFVFAVAVVGRTPFPQRYLKGIWTMLLYSFFLFMMGSIIGAANHGLNITVVVCKA